MSSEVVPAEPADGKRVVLITGGAQGIGYGIAEHLGKAGYKVAIVDLNEGKVAEAEAALTALGVEALGLFGDVCVEEKCDATVAAVTAKWGRLDALVQAAGITGRTGIKSHEVDLADFERVFRVNTTGVFLMAKAALRVMVAQGPKGSGRICNIASIAGKEGNAGMLAYSGSKAAVIGMTKAMGKEYAETGITINAVAPAVVRTAMVDAMPAHQVAYMTDKIPMKRTGEISEIAALVAFMVSPEASFTTGFTFDASGGRATY